MKKSKGATIIEIIIYTLLTLTLLVVLTDIFSSLFNKTKESTSMSEVSTDGKFISMRLYNQISQATFIGTPANLGDTSSTGVFTVNGSNYAYSLSGTNMYLNDGVTNERVNSNGTEVSNLTFTKLGNSGGKSLLLINFRITSTILQSTQQEFKDYLVTVGMR